MGKVLEGEFKGNSIGLIRDKVYISIINKAFGEKKELYLNHNTIERYDLVDEYVGEISMKTSYTDTFTGHRGDTTVYTNNQYVVLVIFRDGKRSLIQLLNSEYAALKLSCKYNLNLKEVLYGGRGINKYQDLHKNDNFSLDNEIKCPRCGLIVLGQADEQCPRCKNLYSVPKKKWGSLEVVTLFLLIFAPYVGLPMMWINKTYYKNTRVQVTVIWAIVLIIAMSLQSCVNNESAYYNDNIEIESTI